MSAKGPILVAILVTTAALVGTRAYWKEPVAPALASLERFFGLEPRDELLGYLETDTTLIAAPVAGRLATRPVRRGEPVAAGSPLFTLETAEIDATLARLDAQIAAAEARLANARTGKRPEELDIIRAQGDEARAALALAEKELDRQRELQKTSASARSQFDQAASQVAQVKARVAALDAQDAAARLAARPDEQAALAADLAAARAARAEAAARRDQMLPRSPVAGRIEETFYDPGEWVPAGSPVLSILPDDGLKIRFFLPEIRLANASVGMTVGFTCDGCAAGLTARIERIAGKPEYTPPVIYSTGARAKLVYLVEARPDTAGGLRPGLPVEVSLMAAKPGPTP